MTPPRMLTPQDEADERQAAERGLATATESHALTPAQMQERSVIHHTAEPRPEVNAFRELRTRLLSITDGRSFTTLVASVSRGSGGSYVCRNLAAAFAFDETRSAVVMDCNPYHPSQHQTMRIDAAQGGLIDYLRDQEMEVNDILYETGVPRLRLIPIGHTEDTGREYFSSFRMHLLLDTLRSRYPARYLFLDSPPVAGSPDARILADLADIVLLVAGRGHDTPAAIAQAASNFDPNKFAGVVFNEGV